MVQCTCSVFAGPFGGDEVVSLLQLLLTFCLLYFTLGHIFSGLRDGRIVKINVTDESFTVITSIVDESSFHCGK